MEQSSFSDPVERQPKGDKITIVRILRFVLAARPFRLALLTALSLRQLPGHAADYSEATFCLMEEDHTLGNALRWMVMKKYVGHLPMLHRVVSVADPCCVQSRCRVLWL